MVPEQTITEREDPLIRLFANADTVQLGFSNAVVISGIDARQLRNGLDRNVFNLGQKLPSVGRWVFTIRETFQLMVVNELTSRVWMPVSQSAQVAGEIASTLHLWGPRVWATIEERESEFIVFNDDGRPRVVVHTPHGGLVYSDLQGNELPTPEPWLGAQVRIPIPGLLGQLMHGYISVLCEQLVTAPNEPA